MGDHSAIEWTEATWNPIVGCELVSEGCDNCYAARDAAGRLKHNKLYTGLATREPGQSAKFTGELRLVPARLDQPARWRSPRRIFVNSMSDLFHPAVPQRYIAEVFAKMALAPRHTFQVLTKRPQRMAGLLNQPEFLREIDDARGAAAGEFDWPLPNVWLGTSIELDKYSWRARHVRETPAAVRFLSLEPLLGALPSLDLAGIGWVIVGGESGSRARAMHPSWARDLRDRCVDAGIPFFFKQWGEFGLARTADWFYLTKDGIRMEQNARQMWLYGQQAAIMSKVGKKAAGRKLDGREWNEMPA